jgi:PII-like signaling protein
LEKIPALIDNHEKKIADLFQDLPVLREVVNSMWNKSGN